MKTPQLGDAWIKGAKRKHHFTPRRHKGSWDNNDKATAHLVPRTARMFHVGDDAVVVTDAGYGYMPFSISKLRELLDEVEAAPVVLDFRTDK